MYQYPLEFNEEEQSNETPNILHSNHKVNREREKLEETDSELKCIKETKVRHYPKRTAAAEARSKILGEALMEE